MLKRLSLFSATEKTEVKIQVVDMAEIQERLHITNGNKKFILHRFTIENAPKFDVCRMEVFFIALLHKGKVLIETDLVTQPIQAPAIYTMAPSVLRKFLNASDDFNSEVIFFDKSFFVEHLADTFCLDNYGFFYTNERHLLPLFKQSYKSVCQYFNIIKEQLQKSNKFADDIIRNVIQIILLEIASIHTPKPVENSYSHNQFIYSVFKEHLQINFYNERKVSFYSNLQHLSSKYFSSIIQQQSGRSAGDMIDEKVILEAKALLHKKELTISQIADLLCFPDASNFGKYFKNLTGISPAGYRKSIQ